MSKEQTKTTKSTPHPTGEIQGQIASMNKHDLSADAQRGGDNSQMTTGFRIFKDGNAWCAVEPHFQNLQESRAGFGETPQEAYLNCVKELEKSNWWRNQPDFPPKFEEFKVEQ